ncbi:hypothetical protein PHYBOEH_007525 [Phytophthora boehmeriae]|uniref:M96 mating-specific protein family n=1 Tax=Phytophthora boehmeriae TaxID=109152 RepID=A0A8T1WAQ9_9STRA|nr:hypothetical protein PHYBOEH_007525 [Phytophthora boehmeriae]
MKDAQSFDSVLSFLSDFDVNSCLDTESYDALPNTFEFLPSPRCLLPPGDDGTLIVDAQEVSSDTAQILADQTEDGGQALNEELSSTGSEIAMSSGTPQTAEKQAKHKPKKARISRKKEIDDLRETVRTLMAELKTLVNDNKLAPRQRLLWKGVAARQLERRQQSEQENVKLRDMLHIQIQEARNLKRVLKRRTKIEMMEEMLGVKRRKILQHTVPKDNPQVFASMLEDIDEIYVGVDAVFSEKGLNDLPCPGRRREAKRNNSIGTFLELTQRSMLPFGLRRTEKAVMKALSQIAFQNLKSVGAIAKKVHFHAYHVEELNNTMKLSFFAETPLPGKANMKGADIRSVVRKYVETDRVVFVCKSLMEPVLANMNKSSGFHTRTTLRVVVHEEKNGSSRKEGFSIVDSHFSATRNDEGLPSGVSIRSTTNLNLGALAWDEAISKLAHQVESLAIDEGGSALSSVP